MPMMPQKTVFSEFQRDCFETQFREHLEKKRVRQDWLYKLISSDTGSLSPHFPFKYDEKKAAEISKWIEPENNNRPQGGFINPSKPIFLISIPTSTQPRLYSRNEKPPLIQKIENQTALIFKEGFWESKKSNMEEATSRLFLTFGMNQFKSIDPSLNNAFRNLVASFKGFDGKHVAATGFFWKIPFAYKYKKKAPSHHDKPRQAFKMVKILDPQRASLLRAELELEDGTRLKKSILEKIPFCKIRQACMDSPATQELVQKIESLAPDAISYFLTMDDDAVSLKAKEQGYFTILDAIIEDEIANCNFPSLISLGYSFDQEAQKLSRVAAQIDMAVRAAMHKAYPLSCYMPEPGVAYYSGYGVEELKGFLENATFVPNEGSLSASMESRRMIKSLLNEGILDPKTALFENKEALITSEPERMKVEAMKFVPEYPEDLKSVQGLKRLKKLSQNHFQKRNFVNNLYFALPEKFKSFKGASGAAVGPISKVFEVFDPIHLFKTILKEFHFDEKEAFDTAFALYPSYIKSLLSHDDSDLYSNNNLGLNPAQVEQLFSIGKASLKKAHEAYTLYERNFSVRWTNQDRARVQDVVVAATGALYESLLKISNEETFN